jgi:hypothetical protein
MNKSTGGLFRAIATRAVIAVIPAAMVSAYASGIFVSPPRMASFEVLPVAEIVVAPNTVGVAESPLYGMTQGEIDAQLDQLQAIGVQSIRVFVPWGLIEQQDNTYDWSLLDKVMTAAAARNMGVMAEINATPNWAAVDPSNPSFPPGSSTPNTAAFVNFVQAFTAHQVTVNGSVVNYASIVSAYEIWNEPNFQQFSNPIDPEAYAALLKAVYPIIKTGTLLVPPLDPTATVVAGAVGATQTGPFTLDPVTYVQRMLDAGAGPYFDALSFHPYSNEIPFSGDCPTCTPNILTPREQLDAIKALIGLSKTIWISEYGVASTDAGGYAQQAAWLTDLLDTWQTYSQAGPVFIYTGRDQAGSTDPGANMGLWTDSGGKKFYTVNGVTYSVSDQLAAWIAAHPQVPNVPNPPVVNPIAALLQALAAQVQAFVNAIVTAITNFFSGLGGAAAVNATAQTLALSVASVESTDAAGLAAKSDASAVDATDATAKDGKEAAKTATETTATEETATDETAVVKPAAVETAVVETPAEVTKTPAVPAVTETETGTTVPAKTAETTTGTTTEPASGASGTPSSSTPSTGTSTETGTKSGEAGDTGKTGDAGKSSDADTAGKAGKDGDHKKDGSSRHSDGKDGTAASVTEVKAKTETVTAGVTAGAEGASDSAGGDAS